MSTESAVIAPGLALRSPAALTGHPRRVTEVEIGPAVCALSFAAFTGAFALPTIGVADGRWHHRTPLRRHELELRGTGLQVRF